MNDESNIRWNEWGRVTPRHFNKTISDFNRINSIQVDIILVAKDSWLFLINGVSIATFNTWEEAEGAAPMLFNLYKEST
jgi:hypothetical protein